MTCVVQKEDAGRILKHFLKTPMGLSQREISRAKFREDGIRINGARRKVNAALLEGDRVEVLLETKREVSTGLTASPEPLKVLYEDEDLLVADKPSGLKIHPNRKSDGDTLANRLAAYLREQGQDSVIRIVGRLDQDTSGVLLAVKNRAAGARLARQREQGILRKTYLALVQGAPKEESGWIRLPIGPDLEHRGRMRISTDGKPASTWYETVAVPEQGVSLLRLRIETGRTHQIRVHMAAIGCPLLGDPIYGDAALAKSGEVCETGTPPKMKRAALHAAELSFLQPFTGARICVKAGLPEDMREICLPYLRFLC